MTTTPQSSELKPSDPASLRSPVSENPDWWMKIVDCQWACPAHTPVPEYIRLIAEGRYTDAYMVNRESNVFPGILGRVCDRPCEPACRRGRLDEKPVAICRLKRVAADFKGEIADRLPKIPQKKNGKRVALIGAGPASLTVANDLMPLGYEVVLYEREAKAGGAMRSQVPGFRLPESVLDQEIDVILDWGVDARFGTPVTSLKELLAEGYDAVFVGSGAPVGRDLDLPGRKEAKGHIHVGLEWLASVAFGHTTETTRDVVVIGGGNTAMDCGRTALRLGKGPGASRVHIVAPEPYDKMLASRWEIEDAEAEGIAIRNNLLPQKFVVENGKLVGVEFQKLRRLFDDAGRWAPEASGEPPVVIPCSTVVLAIGQARAFPWIERDIGVEFTKQDMPVVDQKTFASTHPKVFFGGDSAFGPKNIIWAVAHGHEAAISIHLALSGQSVTARPPKQVRMESQKMGMHDWTYPNAFSPEKRRHVPHAKLEERLAKPKLEVELGFDVQLALTEAKRCLNCDVQTVFETKQCIECDACVDICPLDCLTMTEPAPLPELRQNLSAPAVNLEQNLFVDGPLKTGRVMVKDEDLCIHCGLCAERCPTGAWDMQKSVILVPHAGGGCR